MHPTRKVTTDRAAWILLFVLAVAACCAGEADATDIRGQILGRYPSGYTFPLMGTRVDLFVQMGPSWIPVASWITGNDGMYYMRSIPPGNYFLQVNGRFNYPVSIAPLLYQDIPVIFVPL